ncbi:MAG: hypothetical protein WC700_14490 [Gemmatimonadaceae bacterium]|jgi:hypothetical protein
MSGGVVAARYVDRRACPTCGALVERYVSEDRDGNVEHRPAWVPLVVVPWAASPHPDATAYRDKRGGLTWLVRIDYWCQTCKRDVLSGDTRAYTARLPAYAVVDAETGGQGLREAIVKRFTSGGEGEVVKGFTSGVEESGSAETSGELEDCGKPTPQALASPLVFAP